MTTNFRPREPADAHPRDVARHARDVSRVSAHAIAVAHVPRFIQ
jgi:hypothetical protein